jgi:hypothetical protein
MSLFDLGTDWYKKEIFREAREKGSQRFERRRFWMEDRPFFLVCDSLFVDH